MSWLNSVHWWDEPTALARHVDAMRRSFPGFTCRQKKGYRPPGEGSSPRAAGSLMC